MAFWETPEELIKTLIILFIWIQYVWELYIAIRQHRLCEKTVQVPPELQDVMTVDTFNKARLYTLEKSKFSLVKEFFSTIVTTFIFVSGALAIIWNWCNYIYPWTDEISHSCCWLFLIQTLSTIINLPFSIYFTFVLEEKHGFNKQTAGFYIKDKIKAFIISNVIAIPLSALAIWIIKSGGDYFFFWLWLFIGIVSLVLLTIYPAVIAPLFDKYTPLPEGDLRKSIEALAAQLKFPLGQLYVVEGSKRSAHSNAYFYGLYGSKRIVLFDTLLGTEGNPGCTDEQVLAVLSHELGHWKYGHTIKNLIFMQVNLFLMFAAFSLIFKYEPLYTAMGFDPGVKPVLIGLVAVLQFILAPYNALLGFVLTVLSRHFEFQADAFAVELGKGEPLKEALIQLNKDNLGFPIYDKLYSAWHHSHPPLLQRIDKLIDKNNERERNPVINKEKETEERSLLKATSVRNYKSNNISSLN